MSEDGAWGEWLLFFLRGIHEQAEEAFVRAKLLIETRRRYEEEYAEVPESVRNLPLALFEGPYFTVSEASDPFDVVYQTATNAVANVDVLLRLGE